MPKHLRQLRLDLGLSQEELAFRIGCNQQDISKWESGANISTAKLILLADELKVTCDYLLGRDGLTALEQELIAILRS